MEHMTEQIKTIIDALNTSQVSVLLATQNFFQTHYRVDRTDYFALCKGGELEATDGMTPLDVVVRILNNQLSSLMWIDEKVCIKYFAKSSF